MCDITVIHNLSFFNGHSISCRCSMSSLQKHRLSFCWVKCNVRFVRKKILYDATGSSLSMCVNNHHLDFFLSGGPLSLAIVSLQLNSTSPFLFWDKCNVRFVTKNFVWCNRVILICVCKQFSLFTFLSGGPLSLALVSLQLSSTSPFLFLGTSAMSDSWQKYMFQQRSL
jgi:hypothetical protein